MVQIHSPRPIYLPLSYRLTLQLRLALQRAKLVPTCQSSPAFAGGKHKTKTHLGGTLFPPVNVVEQLFAVAPRHSPFACPIQ